MNLEIRFTLPNQDPQTVTVRDRILIGTLMSNDAVIRAPGIEPIHAMIEVLDDGSEVLTDLGSQSGVQINGKDIDVEVKIKIGDVISLGDVKIDVLAFGASAKENFRTATTQMTKDKSGTNSNIDLPDPPKQVEVTKTHGNKAPPPIESSSAGLDATQFSNTSSSNNDIPSMQEDAPAKKKNVLFSPKAASPSGDVLEVVSYWGDTVLDVELFHPTYKGYETCTIGVPPHAHMLAGGKSDIKSYPFIDVSTKGFKIRQLQDMKSRIRKAGKVVEKKGSGSVSLGQKDIAQIAHGPVKYFIMFVKPPSLRLPRSNDKDRVFATMVALAALFYLAILPAIYMSEGVKDDPMEDDIWSIVNLPEKKEKPKPEVVIPKPKQKIAEVPKPKTPPKPPKPKPKPPKPVPPKQVKKPVKVVKKPQPKPVAKPTKTLANKPKKPKKANAKKGMVSTGAKKPNLKLPGRRIAKKKLGLSGGAKGGGKLNPRGGGKRRGKSKNDLKGVQGGAKNKASGVNLSKLGLGVGKVLNTKGAGAIKTNFSNSAGGAGGGAGSGRKNYGLGGPGKGRALAVSGSGGAANNFGSGFGGSGSGQGGSGGLGGAGLTKGFGRGKGGTGRSAPLVPAKDPVIAGGLSQQEVQAVIRANLNQIRHCYEQLLQRSPSAQGKVKVRFVVKPNGRVGSAKITKSDIRDMVLRGCVTGKVKRWKFPSPRGGQPVTVNYPFVFNPL